MSKWWMFSSGEAQVEVATGCFVLYAWVAVSCSAEESEFCGKQKVAALEGCVE
jgi:hypothetical protein